MRAIGCGLLLPVLAAIGCVSMPFGWPGEKPKPPPPAHAQSLPPPPVTADQVNETNAHEKAQALNDELDREAKEQVKSFK